MKDSIIFVLLLFFFGGLTPFSTLFQERIKVGFLRTMFIDTGRKNAIKRLPETLPKLSSTTGKLTPGHI